MYELLIEPFIEYRFMRHALASVFVLALSSAPIGVVLIMRRMSLMGDAISHAVLPGVAVAFIFAGLNMPMMSLGGFLAGMFMATGSVLASKFSNLKEDANLAAFYLCSLALGVALMSKYGSSVDLLHLLFGSVLAVDKESFTLISIFGSLSIFIFAIIYRPLMMETLDPSFMKATNGKGWLWHMAFQITVVLNLVAGFQSLGTLMSVGLMMLPAISAKLWFKKMELMLPFSSLIAFVSGYLGLVFSYYVDVPSGPAIILVCGIIYIVSLVFGASGGLIAAAKNKRSSS